MTTGEWVRRRMFDPVHRILHWWIGGTVVALTILGGASTLMDVGSLHISLSRVHLALGHSLALGLGIRLAWGLIGPNQARFKALNAAKDGDFGYERPAAIAYRIFYLVVASAVLSGFLLAGMRRDVGPFAPYLFDEVTWHAAVLRVHEASLYAAALFVLAHLGGMMRHEKRHGVPVAQAMVSGYQYRARSKKGESS